MRCISEKNIWKPLLYCETYEGRESWKYAINDTFYYHYKNREWVSGDEAS